MLGEVLHVEWCLHPPRVVFFFFWRIEYFSFIYKIEFKKWNILILYIRLNLKMLVYISLFGNFQLKQQLKITLLQILPNGP